MGILSISLFAIVCAIAVGYWASTLGRSFLGWTIISMVPLIGPFLASIILLILEQKAKNKGTL